MSATARGFRGVIETGSSREVGVGPATVLETARYIAEITNQMASMARKVDLETIAYLLDMARLEAEETVQKRSGR